MTVGLGHRSPTRGSGTGPVPATPDRDTTGMRFMLRH
jgi:hypothetical protein